MAFEVNLEDGITAHVSTMGSMAFSDTSQDQILGLDLYKRWSKWRQAAFRRAATYTTRAGQKTTIHNPGIYHENQAFCGWT